MPGQTADLGHDLDERFHILEDGSLQLRAEGRSEAATHPGPCGCQDVIYSILCPHTPPTQQVICPFLLFFEGFVFVFFVYEGSSQGYSWICT